MVDLVNLQPPPSHTPMLNSAGVVSEPWYWFFRNVTIRLGQGSSNTITNVVTTAVGESALSEEEGSIGTNQLRDEVSNTQLANLYDAEFNPGQLLDIDNYNLIWALNENNPGVLLQWYNDVLAPLTSKGDLLSNNGYTNIRVPVGTDGQIVYADSTTVSGLRWGDTGCVEFPFNFGDATPKPLFTIDANKIIEEVFIIIMEVFDAASTLEVGTAVTPDELFAATDINTLIAGTFAVSPAFKYGVATALELTITAGASTQGSGLVKIIYQK